MSWKILIHDNKLRSDLEFHLKRFERQLASRKIVLHGLLSGKAGISFFWKYRALMNPSKISDQKFDECSKECWEALEKVPLTYNLSNGVTGILWSLASHEVNDHLSFKVKHCIGKDIHEFLISKALEDLGKGSYDYLHNGLSVLMYLLCRTDIIECRSGIEQIVDKMDSLAHRYPEGVAWVAPSALNPNSEKLYNLGLAHGLPSIIAMLTRIWESGISPAKTYALLEQSISWLLEKSKWENGVGVFPNTIPTPFPYSSRLAWCYGDLGIAIALLQAGLITKRSDWIDASISVAGKAAKRSSHNSGVKDASICHGSAGIAHIFNRFFNYTDNNIFQEAAIKWINATVDFYKVNGHFKQLITYRDSDKISLKHRSGMLEGISGIGLVFMAALTDQEPKWDRCLLLS